MYTLCLFSVSLASSAAYASKHEKAFGGLLLLTTAGGFSYEPRYLQVSDSALYGTYSTFMADATTASSPLRSFEGMGLEAEAALQVGGGVFVGANLGWQYRNDLTSHGAQPKNSSNSSYAYNEILFLAIDVGLRGGGEGDGGFSWTTSVGFGSASNSMSGRYPAFASKEVATVDGLALRYKLANGATAVYYSSTDFSFYFGQFRVATEFFRSKANGSRFVLGYKLMYSDKVNVLSEDAAGLEVTLPTGPVVCVPATGICPVTIPAALTAKDVTVPLQPSGRYYIQGFAFRSHVLEVGVRWPLGVQQK